jgi:predicted GNAT family N-acyltransferase
MQNRILFQALQDSHDTAGFSCGVAPLDKWLREVARQHIRKGISRTFCAVDADEPAQILGYYSLTVAELDTDKLPKDVARKLPQRAPLVLIGRLATALTMRGQGLGSLLLVDALRRIVEVSNNVGVTLIMVDAKDDQASSFYQHFGFVPLPANPLRLVLPVATARQVLS